MKDIVQLIKNYNKYSNLAKLEYDMIFTKNTKIILIERIIEISREITRGRDEPTTCTEKYSIPFGLIRIKEIGKNPFESYPFESYYGRCIEWDIRGEYIVANIQTGSAGEFDSCFEYTIPVDDDKYRMYLASLQIEADKREENRFKTSQLLKKQEQNKEHELYIRLKEKYEHNHSG